MADFFSGKIALVTGAASGIGKALGEELCRRGAHAIVTDVNIQGAELCADEICKAGGSAEAMNLDVTDAGAVKRAVEETVARHGRIDYLFNNAGIAVGADTRDTTLDDWKQVIDVDLWGVIHGIDAAYGIMIDQGFGHIVNTASMAGLMPFPFITSYTASKHAVVGLSLALRAEGKDLGVRFSVVCPGFVETGIFDASKSIKIDRGKLFDEIPFAFSPNYTARRILRQVQRNRAVITPTPDGRPIWWIYRTFPWLFTRFFLNMIRTVRKMKTEQPED
jgi:NAD(P)-dependent dehydrogenase (short-subunit alcohol dehydrogenase family)